MVNEINEFNIKEVSLTSEGIVPTVEIISQTNTSLDSDIIVMPQMALEVQHPEAVAKIATLKLHKDRKLKLTESNIHYECKLCKEVFFDRKKARNHICDKHKIESKLINANRNPVNKKQGKMCLINRVSEWIQKY